jgi:hypothetical protein
MMRFLESHFSELEGRKDLIQKSVSEVDSVLRGSLESLRKSTEASIGMMRKFTEEEIQKLDHLFHQNPSSLSHLNVLPQMQTAIDETGREMKHHYQALNSVLLKLNENIDGLAANLQKNVKAEKDRESKEGVFLKAFRRLFFISGALVFTGICVYSLIWFFGYLFLWIGDVFN